MTYHFEGDPRGSRVADSGAKSYSDKVQTASTLCSPTSPGEEIKLDDFSTSRFNSLGFYPLSLSLGISGPSQPTSLHLNSLPQPKNNIIIIIFNRNLESHLKVTMRLSSLLLLVLGTTNVALAAYSCTSTGTSCATLCRGGEICAHCSGSYVRSHLLPHPLFHIISFHIIPPTSH